MSPELKKISAERFKQYCEVYPDKLAEIQAEKVLKDHPFNGTLVDSSTYLKRIQMHQAYFDVNNIPYTEIDLRKQIEGYSLEQLKNLSKGDLYFGKGGDLDFFLEDPERWEQVGSGVIEEVYRSAIERGADIKIIGATDPVRKDGAGARKLLSVTKNIGLNVRVIDHPLKAILIKLANGLKKALVWYSHTHVSTYYQSHDPAYSYYTGYIIDTSDTSKEQQINLFMTSLELVLTELYGKAQNLDSLIVEQDKLEIEKKVKIIADAESKKEQSVN